jgi:hypothetical protein
MSRRSPMKGFRSRHSRENQPEVVGGIFGPERNADPRSLPQILFRCLPESLPRILFGCFSGAFRTNDQPLELRREFKSKKVDLAERRVAVLEKKLAEPLGKTEKVQEPNMEEHSAEWYDRRTTVKYNHIQPYTIQPYEGLEKSNQAKRQRGGESARRSEVIPTYESEQVETISA